MRRAVLNHLLVQMRMTPARTPAQHLDTVNSNLRESPFDPVLHPNGEQWVQRLRETVANLNSAFAAIAEPLAQDLLHLEEYVHDGAETEVSHDPCNHPS